MSGTGSTMDVAITQTALVARAAAGDRVAFASIVDTYHGDMARVAYVVCGDADVAEDAVQAAWSVAWRKLGSLRDPERLRSWLVAVAANEARQLVRRRNRLAVVEIDIESVRLVDRSGRRDPRPGRSAYGPVRGCGPNGVGQTPLRRSSRGSTEPYTAGQEDAMDLLAVTLLGFTFSGTLALALVIVVVVAIGIVWFASTRRRRR